MALRGTWQIYQPEHLEQAFGYEFPTPESEEI